MGLELVNLLGDRGPPRAAGHIDKRKYTVPFPVSVGDDKNVPILVVLLNEFAGFLAERGDSAEAGGITTYHHYWRLHVS